MRPSAINYTVRTSPLRPKNGFGSAAICLLLGSVTMMLHSCGKVPAITAEDTSPIDLVSVSVWDPAYLGTLPGEIVGLGGQAEGCMGFVDNTTDFPESGQTRLEGWAWNAAKSARYQAFIVTGSDGRIAGAGVTTVNRPDVRAALPQRVSDDLTGYVAFAQGEGASVQIYGWDTTDDTLCQIQKTE